MGDDFTMIDEKEFAHTLQAMHDNNFFALTEETLIAPLSEKLEEKQCQSLFGLIIGTALDNKRLIRTSLNEIIKDKDIKTDILDGMISVLLQDIESEDSIKAFC
jgi:hypothetical protein